uniref:Uncharacterized protein n=1 Tax=uncultured bacterium contig00037 TaxID=1181525 RepID=A0A806KFD9_9BACT|nr:hypothetical protein [uncultured bacterium contig00037]
MASSFSTIEQDPPEKGFTGLVHSFPQMSQKKLNEKPFPVEWSTVNLVSVLCIIILFFIEMN